jgi:predicted MFS family arabinose efflux permease
LVKPVDSFWKRDFTRFWFSDTISQFGNVFTTFSIPVLAVLTFDVTPIVLGVLVALATLPYSLLGLFVGVWADRFKKRRVMIICNVGRLLSLGSIPVAFFLGVLTLPQIFVVVLTNGILSAFFDVSYQAYLPILVDRSEILEGNQKLQLSASAAQVVGPGIAGYVYQVLGGALAVGADALGYLISALSLFSIKKVEEEKEGGEGGHPDFFREMKEGVHFVFGNRILSSVAACAATGNLGTYMVASVLTIFALRSLGFSAFELGAAGTIGATGLVFGALVANRMTSRLGLGVSLVVAQGFDGAAALYPVSQYGSAFLVFAVVNLLISFSTVTFGIFQVSLRQAMTPDRLQGRMNATMRTMIWATVPVGSLTGGLLGATIGLADTLYLGGIISALASAWIILGPTRKLKGYHELVETQRRSF